MSKTLIIGYGNTLRRDDGAGPLIAKAVKERCPEVTILTPFQLLPEHAEDVADADLVIFVDASVEGTPGEVRVREVLPNPTDHPMHVLSPETILHLAGGLFGHTPKAHLVTVTGEDFDLGEGASGNVETSMERAVILIRKLAL